MKTRIASETGAALLIALLAVMVVSALAVCVLDTSTTETLISANQAAAQQALYTAEAGLERSLSELLDTADWNQVLSGASSSSFRDGGSGWLPDGRRADLAELTRELQAESDAFYGGGMNRPVWQLYAHAPVRTLLPGDSIPLTDYVVVWVGDDPEDTDNDPTLDSNGILILRADGHGIAGARRGIEAAVRRRVVPRGDAGEGGEASEVGVSSRVVWWREVR